MFDVTSVKRHNMYDNQSSGEVKKAQSGTPLYVNKKIETDNFVFDDKGGKFFMYADVVARHTDANKVEVRSVQDEDGKPRTLEVKTTMLKDGLRPTCSPAGSRAFLKMDYERTNPNELFYLVDSLLRSSQGLRSYEQLSGDDIYMACHKNAKMKFITKEEFEDPNYDFNK